MKVEGGTLQMASTLTFVNNFMELIEGQVITWRSLALVVTTLVLVAIFHNVCSLIMYFWWTPRRLRCIMEKQGWKGPKTFHILAGNMQEIFKFRDEEFLKDLGIRNFDIESRILPQYALYSQKYGDKFFYSMGPNFRIVVTDPNLVKEILTNKLYYKEPLNIVFKLAFFGEGLFTINGKDWTERRQIMEHAFRHEALKEMVNIMVKATASVLDTWEQKVQDGGGSTQLEINNDMSTITSHIISHTTFGNNYKEGQQIFEQMEALVCNIVEAFKNPLFFLPGFRFIPIPKNREISKLIHKNEKILKQIIQIRQEQEGVDESFCAKDILDLMMSTHSNNYKRKVVNGTTCQLNIQNLVDECKTLFLAGYATTTSHLTWTMLLLAEYPEWQERARIEVWEVCGFNNEMDVTKLNQMKIVGMILNEVHRLFPILPQLTRLASKDMQLGDIFVPKGLILEIPVLHMHHDPKLWGENVMEFDPNRFAKGVSKACQHQQSFIPFAFGPRNCLGQNFSLMESKVVIASVLSRFQLSVSPSYKHCPVNFFLHSPKFGVQLIIKSLKPSQTS